MASRAAIRNEGNEAEERFLKLVADARTGDQAKKGDAIVTVDGADSYVEIKQCQSSGGTINQVRAIKYIPCVIWAPSFGGWFILSPDQLVELALHKKRGQHTEISFECINFGLRSIPESLHTTCKDEKLSEMVHMAIRRGRRHPRLQMAMRDLLKDIQSLKQNYINQVSKLISE